MNSDTLYSDEMLNAYIDGELKKSAALNLSEALLTDLTLRARVEELRVIRDLVRLSYNRQTCKEIRYFGILFKNTRALSLAVSVLIIVGILSSVTTSYVSKSKTIYDIATAVDNIKSNKNKARNVMVHVTSADKYRWKIILNEIEKSLIMAESKGETFKLRLVTNAKGMGLVKHSKKNPFSKRLQKLIAEHPNFAVKVCKQTLERIESRSKRKFKVIPGAQIIPSALGEVIEKRKKGWIYIKL